jgi:hypothetical protein
MSSRLNEVVVLDWDAPTTSGHNAQKIAAFLGAEVNVRYLNAAILRESHPIEDLVPRSTCLVVAAETLARASAAMQCGVLGLRGLTCSAEHVFVYGFQATDAHAAILKALSSGSLLGIQSSPDTNNRFHIAEGHRKWCGQFSGLSLRPVDAATENVFIEASEGRCQKVMIRLGDKPFFVCTADGGSQFFFVSSSELADLDESVHQETRLVACFAKLVPLLMFLRGALGDRVWHNDHPQACFIIDDPLLKKRYGFLDYRRLAESMRQHQFSTCIAFIPWNYRRSSKKIAKLISSSGMPYLCVHGCDHTAAEFATKHFESLRGKAQLALDRMRAHSHLSGLPFDEVMVFPQGSFSGEAMMALKATGYLAAINTHVQPSIPDEGLALRDLLEVAVTRFANFPLFGRRYPSDFEDLVFDLFLGKPALAVEHHGYFKNGYDALHAFVARLSAVDERLQWANPATICSRACVIRTAGDGDIHVWFYANRFWLRNDGNQIRNYVLFRRQTTDGPSPSVTINGSGWTYEHEDGRLRIRLSLAAGQTAEIRVVSGNPDHTRASCPQTTFHEAKVAIRRIMCEFRDNHVDTNRILSGIVSAVRGIRAQHKAVGELAQRSSTADTRFASLSGSS